MKIAVAILIIFSQLAKASFEWMQKAEPVLANSEIQKIIDDVTKELFLGHLKDELCTVFSNAENLSFSMGISTPTAAEITTTCPQKITTAYAKYFQKNYFIVQEPFANLDSWTDTANRTYIFADQGLTREKLKSIILHELVIAVDAKANMLFTTYKTYQALIKNTKSNIIHVKMSDLSSKEEKLRIAFNFSTWSPISQTFAALRAFEYEAMAENKKFIKNHFECVEKFKQNFAIIRLVPDFPQELDVAEIIDMIASNSSIANKPNDLNAENKNMDFILDPGLKIKDLNGNKVSFCEFMAQPLIINRTLYNFFSRGPRPRTTGGVDD